MDRNDTSDRLDAAPEETTTNAAERPRRPYVSPCVESGVAFEKVLLMSGCNSGFFCPVPC